MQIADNIYLQQQETGTFLLPKPERKDRSRQGNTVLTAEQISLNSQLLHCVYWYPSSSL